MSLRTLALLGDSILDNAPYTRPEPDTAAHLRRLLGAGWSVSLLARDGAVMADVAWQLRGLTTETSCAVLSIGGNDATRHIGLLERPASSAADVLDEVATIAEGFGADYDAVAADLARRVPRLILCTIYEPPLFNPAIARLARVPLAVLNDRIVRTGARLGVELLDLRAVCTRTADFVHDIEPSAAGAAKIASAIAAVVSDQPPRSARVFAP